MISLSQLAIYPIKSTAQVSLNQTQISPFGLAMDRRWMLIDEQGIMLTQRKFARMCLIQSHFEADSLIVNAPDMPSLNIAADNGITRIQAKVWADNCNALDCGDKAATWFSDFLNTPARLVFFPADEIRQVDLNFAKAGNITAFSDGFPYLLISQASLDDLNTRLSQPVTMTRFRPNLVVQDSLAFAEDNWKKIRIGNIIFNVVKPCSRCVIPSINPQTAEKTAHVVKTLSHYRMRDNKIYFGQNLIAEGTGKFGELSVGMEVEILE